MKRHIEVEPMMSISEVMPLLGVSRQTVIREIQARRLPASRVRWQYRIRESDLAAYQRRCSKI